MVIALAGAHAAPAAAQLPMASGMWLPDPGDGSWIIAIGEPVVVRPGRWVGAQPGLFAQSPAGTPAFAATRVGTPTTTSKSAGAGWLQR